MPEPRDNFERLVERRFSREERRTGEECPDPELLAAYVEGQLSLNERTAVEAHAADCPACVSALGMLVRTQPEAAAREARWLRAWWPSLAAVSVAVLAVVIWVRMPGSAPMSGERVVIPAQQTSRGVAAPADQRAADAAAGGNAVNDTLREEPVPGERASALPKAHTTDRPAGVPREERAQPRESATPRMSEAAPGAGSANSAFEGNPASPAPPPAAADGSVRQKASAPEQDLAASPAPASGQLMAARDRARASAPAPEPSSAESEGRTVPRPASAFAASPLVVSSPEPDVRWRIVDGRVERTTDNGGTWQEEAATGVDGMALGSAPSTEACWLASRDGRILRRSAGGVWTSSHVLADAPLTGLRANTDLSAEVTTSTGRRLATLDGGRSWNEATP